MKWISDIPKHDTNFQIVVALKNLPLVIYTPMYFYNKKVRIIDKLQWFGLNSSHSGLGEDWAYELLFES